MRARTQALAALILALVATPALAGPVTLKAAPVDDDGAVTLGDLFDGAGAAASGFVVARPGPSVVLDAGQLQGLAQRHGLTWSNPQNLRRVVVRAGATPAAAPASAGTPAARASGVVEALTYVRSLSAGEVVRPEDVAFTPVQAHLVQAGAPGDAEAVIGLSARRALRAGAMVMARDLASPQVIARGDAVEVAFVAGGVRLTVSGRATRAAAVGDPVTITNAASGRPIEAVATGPGRAVVGPAAERARAAHSSR